MNENQKFITIKGAKENNLQNVNLKIPKNQLVVFTGVSGSGKSSLAFDTIYEEGRRRYVESLSSYARQFLGNTTKPLVDAIEGLSPAISIEQKTTHNNPRSTVGTVTEIYDYLRLLYARLGKPHCPKHKTEISAQTNRQIIDAVYKNKTNSRVIILAPVVKNERGTHANLFSRLKRDGFLRVRINGEVTSLDDSITLSKNKRHNIEIVVDRIVLDETQRQRIQEAVEIALEHGQGFVNVEIVGEKVLKFSKFYSCDKGDFNMPMVDTRLFSFNSPAGMCPDCKGLGLKLKVDPKKLMPDKNLTINQGGVVYYKNLLDSSNLEWQEFNTLLGFYNIDKNTKLRDLTPKEIEIILEGSDEEIEYTLLASSGNQYQKLEIIEGTSAKIERKFINSSSERIRAWYKNTFMSDIECSKCKGQRLNGFALAVQINEQNIFQFTQNSVSEALRQIQSFNFTDEEKQVANIIVNEITNRLQFLHDVGLNYMSLDRKAETLSGGESQRIRLATQIGSNLTGVLYVLDEPSIGLHQKDTQKLIATLKKMVDIGNTLIVVEHDETTIQSADYIVDIGPMAGHNGGHVVVAGTPDKVKQSKNSLTGGFLARREMITTPSKRRGGNGKFLEIRKATEHNLQKVSVKIPLNKFTVVTGVSGSGKSTLVNEVLSKGISQKISNPFIVPGRHESIQGIRNIDKVVKISQSPIGRTPRSNPATYTGVFDDIRDLFAQTTVARSRGYLKGRFSFNVEGGRCDKCRGDGVIKIEMHFLPDVYVNCDNCDGKRYNSDTLDAKYKSKNIHDVLAMHVEEALAFFQNNRKIRDKLKTLHDVGLGYIALGQSATTLSGGEAQRVKLATYLLKKPTGKTIYLFDEPTTGLHQYDVNKLIKVLNRIVDNGDSVVVIEHNLDIIKVADYVIDLGPGGGAQGGKVVAKGTPEQVAKVDTSFTGQFLRDVLLVK